MPIGRQKDASVYTKPLLYGHKTSFLTHQSFALHPACLSFFSRWPSLEDRFRGFFPIKISTFISWQRNSVNVFKGGSINELWQIVRLFFFEAKLFVSEGVWRAIRLNEQANWTKNGASRIQSNLFELLRRSLFYIKRVHKMTKRKKSDIKNFTVVIYRTALKHKVVEQQMKF